MNTLILMSIFLGIILLCVIVDQLHNILKAMKLHHKHEIELLDWLVKAAPHLEQQIVENGKLTRKDIQEVKTKLTNLRQEGTRDTKKVIRKFKTTKN